MVCLFQRATQFIRRPFHRTAVQFHQSGEPQQAVVRRFPARRRLRLVFSKTKAVAHG